MIKIDNYKFNEEDFNKLATKVNMILAGQKKLKPTLMNKLYFYSMKSIIKDDEKYFQYETKVWKEKGWI